MKTDISCTKTKSWEKNPVKRQYKMFYEMFDTLCDEEKHCATSNILKQFNQCSGILQFNVIPYSLDKTNSERMQVACSALRTYQKCLEMKFTPCNSKGKFASDINIRQFTVTAVDKFKWVCNYVPQPTCEESETASMFQECFKYLANHTRKTLTTTGRNSRASLFERMCSDVKAYQFCIHSTTQSTCKQKLVLPESAEIRQFTRNYYNIYNWSCDLFLGNYAKLDSTLPGKGAEQICTKGTLLPALASCTGFLQVHVYPKLDKYLTSGELAEACR